MADAVRVLIVGAGPVGLTLAAELTRYGVPVRIVDRAAARTDRSKALVLWSRSLELLERMGEIDRFVAAGMKGHGARISSGRQLIGEVSFDQIESPYPYALMIPQSETERLLETRLAEFGVRVEREVELLRFSARADGVTAILRDTAGREEMAEAEWLVGCDGAHSQVRHGLGFEFAGSTQLSNWVLADMHLDGLGAPDKLDIFWHRDGILAFFPIVRDRYRVVADLGPAEAEDRRADPTLAEVQALVDQRGPGGVRLRDPVWLASFRINERKVRDYAAGRVFLAGDAAHIHSPAGGQGMNTGMQDAFNLAWKLALVAKGATKASLLDSYSIERSAVGDRVLRNAGRMTDVAILRNPIAQTVRNAAAKFVLGLSQVQRHISDSLSEIEIAYPEGPLSVAGPHAPHGGKLPTAGERWAPVVGDSAPIGSGAVPLFAMAGPEDVIAQLAARFPGLVDAQSRPSPSQDGLWVIRPDGYVGLVAGRDEYVAAEQYLAAIAP
jgi:2-polyprenyl-6-methoxyphenol hydroxylase-like FAD-dependent oxidoreductase